MLLAERVLAPDAVEAFLAKDQKKGLLRFATAGSVDDGKSTLIGRLLYEARGVYEDQLAAIKKSAVNRSSGPIDFSLLTDGLRAEREQGITIDVAYRYFATPKRKFIIADTPGHEQYTRNMATGASNADLAIILIDARYGVLPQSCRHAVIAALLGIPHIVVAVNKIDLVGFDAGRFEQVRIGFNAHLVKLGITNAQFIPISALEGDNVTLKSDRTQWYDGPSLLDHLESVSLESDADGGALRFPVQYVIRPDSGFRGYAGQAQSGVLRVGDSVLALPSGRSSRIKSVVTRDGNINEAGSLRPVTVCLEDELDVGRGDMLVSPDAIPHVSRRLEAMLVWMSQTPLQLDRSYLLKQTTQSVAANVTALVHRLNIETLTEDSAETLAMNDIGRVTLETAHPLFFDAYETNRRTGSFILIDPISNATVAAGMLFNPSENVDALQRDLVAARRLEFHDARITPTERRLRLGHGPAAVWLAGRSTLADLLEIKLFRRGCQTCVVADAEAVLLPELAKRFCDAGLIVLLAPEGGSELGETVQTRCAVERFVDADGGWPADDVAAADAIIAALERRGILPQNDAFSDAGGI